MKSRERFTAVFKHSLPDDRLPMIEWASWWWDGTIMEWQKQGLPDTLGFHDVAPYLHLDQHYQFWFPHRSSDCPQPAFNGGPIAEDEEEYERILPYLYPMKEVEAQLENMKALKPGHDNGDYPIWFSLDGGFWFPRTILGIENHLYSFYDQPELYHRILDDLAEFQLGILERMYKILTPDFMTFGEDMSYNNGPMISEDSFDEFLLPYYNKVIPFI